MPRRLVADLNATAAAWALPEEGMAQLRDAAPAGWEAVVIDAPTSEVTPPTPPTSGEPIDFAPLAGSTPIGEVKWRNRVQVSGVVFPHFNASSHFQASSRCQS